MKMKMKMKVNDCVRKEGSDSMAPDGKRTTLDDLFLNVQTNFCKPKTTQEGENTEVLSGLHIRV